MLYLSRYLLSGIIFSLLTCGEEEPGLHDKVTYVDRSGYYYNDAEVIRKNDTVIIVNRKLDTTLVATGILTWLRYDYPACSNYTLVYYIEHALELEKRGATHSARYFYRLITDYHVNKRVADEASFSDGNDYYTAGINAAIIYSYAYEKLGNIDQSIIVLTRFLANYETHGTRIQERYIRQCIRRYGKAKVLQAIENSAVSIRLKKDEMPENSFWVVDILGAAMGVAESDVDKVTVQEANHIIRQSAYYKFAKAAADTP